MGSFLALVFTLLAASATAKPVVSDTAESLGSSENNVITTEHIWGTLWRVDEATGEWRMNEIDCLDISEEQRAEAEKLGPNVMFFECPIPMVENEDGSLEEAKVVKLNA
jgi:hypothetical protein